MKNKKSKITRVMKFGGSSVGSAERIKDVCKIILNNANAAKKHANHAKISHHSHTVSHNPHYGLAVVVSAMQGVTDKLLALDFNFVKEKHLTAAKELKVPAPIELLNELENVIKGIKLLGDASPMALDLVASFGERLSANLVAAYLNKKIPSVAVDARELVKTNSDFQNAAVDFQKTNRNIKKSLYPKPHTLNPTPVITGFIASAEDGKTTTLGRGGSDYSAAIFGAALNVDVVEIWTDADGVMTADPRVVPAAFTLPQISYEEAFEMAYFGAKVIHPATMLPVIKKNIPILIKNTFNPKHPGTIIGRKQVIVNSKQEIQGNVKNISTIDGISLINIGGTNLAGVPGTAERVFKAVAEKKVNVILIAQASSEHTICFAVSSKGGSASGGKKSEADLAIAALKGEFENEIRRGKVVVERKDGKSIIAVVGDNMRGVPGVAGRIFNVLGTNKINISAIAQGGSERNISCVVDKAEKNGAVSAIHQEFFTTLKGSAPIFLLGTGNVGGELLKQISNLKPQTSNLEQFKVCGIADVNKMHFDNQGIDLKNWKKILRQSESKNNLAGFLEKVGGFGGGKVLVDCTASEAVAKKYQEFVAAGCHIVTPNKKANVLPIAKYNALRKALANHKKTFHYQANVGAGLPVIESVKRLIGAGDQIKKIEGIFSGTLSYLFNNFDGKRKFSALVAEAKEKGYTEPDPREDLSGQDVGRKLLILARELGWPVEFSDVQLENLALYSDDQMSKKFKNAKMKKRVLRYVGAVANGRLSAKLKEVNADSPLAHVSGADNIVAIYSNYYKKQPLVIKGPGAGAEVTASAVLAGIIKICNEYRKS